MRFTSSLASSSEIFGGLLTDEGLGSSGGRLTEVGEKEGLGLFELTDVGDASASGAALFAEVLTEVGEAAASGLPILTEEGEVSPMH